MNTKQIVHFIGQWLVFILLAFSTATAHAQDEADDCGLTIIQKAFNQYRENVARSQVLKIQTRLNELANELGYDLLDEDGLLGKDTRRALQTFCYTQNVTGKEDKIAETLVELLFKPASDTQTPTAAAEVSGPAVFDRCSAPQEQDAASSELQDDAAVYYRFTAQDFIELEARGAILQQLETLKDTEYLTEYTLKTAVEEVLAELTKLGSEYAATVLKTAEQFASYRLTEQSFDSLRLANVPEAALEPLQMLNNLPYTSEAELGKAVAFRLRQEPKPAAQDASSKQTENEDPAAQDTATQQTESVDPVAIDYSEYATRITAQAQQVTVYRLTDESFAKLNTKPDFRVIPAALLGMLGKLQDVEYIDRPQFIRAICGTFEILSRDYQDEVARQAGDASRVSDISLENLKAKGVPDYILDVLTPLKDRQYADRQQLKSAVNGALVDLAEKQKFQDFYPLLAQQARRIVPESLIRWSGGSCGCSRELSDEVYGFYPFWLADRVKVPEGADPNRAEQELDFSALTRIGYYGVNLDAQGGIKQARHWSNGKHEVGFVKAAKKYHTKLDLVVYTNAWHTWSKDEVANAAAIVAKKLNLQLPPSKFDQFKSLLPFTENTRATMGDGVTIYFDDYTNPAKADARNNIASFIKKLHQELQTTPKPLYLNIMLNVNWNELGEGGELFTEELRKILEKTESDVEPNVDLILVLLEQPTTDTKKKLRSKIENEFKGEDRRTVLRKIVPVISPTGQDKEPDDGYAQFIDDLIYFEDNFTGVGLWPLLLAQDPGTQEINRLIVKYFKPKAEQDFMERMVAQYIPQLCNYACPNRWLFRILFDILAIGLILLAIWSLSNCHLRERIKAYPWPVLGLLAATILVFSTSLVCDPFWNQRSDDVTIGLLTTAFLFGLWRYIRKLSQGKLP